MVNLAERMRDEQRHSQASSFYLHSALVSSVATGRREGEPVCTSGWGGPRYYEPALPVGVGRPGELR